MYFILGFITGLFAYINVYFLAKFIEKKRVKKLDKTN